MRDDNRAATFAGGTDAAFGAPAIGLQIDGIEVMVCETKNADGFYEAWAFLSSGVLDGVLVGHAFARTKQRAKAYAIGKYIQDQIAASIAEDGW